eukprot:359802-Chlamydomonas_euryale.AAC.9
MTVGFRELTFRLFHLSPLSPFTFRLFHLPPLSSFASFTFRLFHLSPLSPFDSFTFRLFHLSPHSPFASFIFRLHLSPLSPRPAAESLAPYLQIRLPNQDGNSCVPRGGYMHAAIRPRASSYVSPFLLTAIDKHYKSTWARRRLRH